MENTDFMVKTASSFKLSVNECNNIAEADVYSLHCGQPSVPGMNESALD